jgi:hypothetical protein
MNLRLTNMGEPRLVMVLKDDMSNMSDIIQVLQLAGFDDVSCTNLNAEAPYWFVSESGSDPGVTCGALSPAGYTERFDINYAPIGVHDEEYDGFMSEKFKKFVDDLRRPVRGDRRGGGRRGSRGGRSAR